MARNLAHTILAAAVLLLAGASPGPATAAPAAKPDLQTAIFAGGCFWCVQSDFDKVPGVVRTVAGYTGGHVKNPTYEEVSSETTGHREAVKITFDANKVSYKRLLYIFWRSVDPTDAGGQFCDRGPSYETAIFVTNDEQRRLAEASKAALEKSGILGKPIVTPILPAGPFYPAEDYHQEYYKKNPIKYRFYRFSCGRDDRIRELWGNQAFGGISHD